MGTFNVLAPVYKRMKDGNRESQYPEVWRERATNMSTLLRDQLLPPLDALCVQEWWCNESYAELVEETVGDQFDVHSIKRPGTKQDGLAIFLRKDRFAVRAMQREMLGTKGNRVAQLMLVEDLQASSLGYNVSPYTVMVNTHLTFPHHHPEVALQLRQAKALTKAIKSFMARHLWMNWDGLVDTRTLSPSFNEELKRVPAGVVVCGDFNAEVGSDVWQHMVDSGLVDSYYAVHNERPDAPAGSPCSKFVSHKDHRGRCVGVDHVFVGASNGVSWDNDAAPSGSGTGRFPRLKRSRSMSTLVQTPARSMVLPRASGYDMLPTLLSGVTGVPPTGVAGEILDAAFYPKSCCPKEWPVDYNVSDHRPLCVDLSFRLE